MILPHASRGPGRRVLALGVLALVARRICAVSQAFAELNLTSVPNLRSAAGGRRFLFPRLTGLLTVFLEGLKGTRGGIPLIISDAAAGMIMGGCSAERPEKKRAEIEFRLS